VDRKEKATEFDNIAETIFFPIYPIIAARMLEIAAIRGGLCLDIGSGGGHLGIALSKLWDGEVILADNNPAAVEIAARRLAANRAERIETLFGDVHDLPLAQSSVDLVVSRGAMWFWDKARSLLEIWRILADGGAAVLGAGFGNKELSDRIAKEMTVLNGEDWPQSRKRFTDGASPSDYADIASDIGLPSEVIKDESGEWLVLRKSAAGEELRICG
jgi:ubiquinone/menaquinone biosynthesis C-methylase UbiE